MHIYRLCTALCLLLDPVSAGSGNIWWTKEYEYNYVECLVLIVLLFLATLFETVWHHFSHPAQHSYHYGVLHDTFLYKDPHADEKDSHGNFKHVRLYKELVNRMGGEFMTLGFLAFIIFVCNQTYFFEIFLDWFPNECSQSVTGISPADCLHLPTTDTDWFFMTEVVHVKLFLGMMMYFFLISRVVIGSSWHIKQWEKLQMRRVGGITFDELTGMSSGNLSNIDADLRTYNMMREYFVENIIAWGRTRPKIFEQMLLKVNMQDCATSEEVNKRVRAALDERFSFSAYCALNVEKGVRDSIEVGLLTWIIVAGIFAIIAALARHAQVEFVHISTVLLAISILILILMHVMQRNVTRKIKQYSEDDKKDLTDSNIHVHHKNRRVLERFSVEKYTLRLMQVFTFLFAYSFARTVGDVYDWNSHFYSTLVYSLLYFAVYVIYAAALPGQVVSFLQLMAMPPFFDDENAEVLLGLMVDDHVLNINTDVRESIRRSIPLTPINGQHDEPPSCLFDTVNGTDSGLSEAPTASLEELSSREEGAFIAVTELKSILEEYGKLDINLGIESKLRQRLQQRGLQVPLPVQRSQTEDSVIICV